MWRPAAQSDRGDHRRRVRGDGPAVDPGVPDVLAGKTGQTGAPGRVGAAPTAFDRFWPAVGVPLVVTGASLA